jgi:hypothetical protein
MLACSVLPSTAMPLSDFPALMSLTVPILSLCLTFPYFVWLALPL